MALPSYYFTLFKKLQVMANVPAGLNHGAATPSGRFDLKDPQAPWANPAMSRGPRLHPTSNTPAHSPLWAVLNERIAVGNPPNIATVTVANPPPGAATSWPVMPRNPMPGWAEFQTGTASPNTIVDRLGAWISQGKVNDVPAGVIAAKPPAFTPPAGGPRPFVCSSGADQGARPTGTPADLPADFWNTSLIYLVHPGTGAIQTPAVLAKADTYNMVAVIGNRGSTAGGRFAAGGSGRRIQAKAAAMVWNTSLGPGVELPSLSNLDPADIGGTYEQYFLPGGEYDLVGFQMPVKTMYDGIVAAVQAQINAGTFTLPAGVASASDWVAPAPGISGAHVCLRVAVREDGSALPNYPYSDTPPYVDARIAQKNLVPFDIDVRTPVNPMPPINWRNFVAGQPLFMRLRKAGANRLSFRARLPKGACEMWLAVGGDSFRRYFKGDKTPQRGFERVAGKALRGVNLPWEDAVLLRATGMAASIDFSAMPEGCFGCFAFGTRFDGRLLKPGPAGSVTVAQETVLPIVNEKLRSYELERRCVGGFTVQVRAVEGARP